MNTKKKSEVIYFRILIICITFLSLQSCTTNKDIIYFQNTTNNEEFTNVLINSKIQINDILNIKVNSKIAITAMPFNNESTSTISSMDIDVLKIKGYLVDIDGNINFPILGEIKVTDKSTMELEKFLKEKLINEEQMVDATVTVRILNSKVTILGEVNKPGTYNFTEQNLTLLQAIGLAGDLTINGKRNDILLIKMEGNTKVVSKIDMTKTDWFTSPNFYVKNNDVIVVSPNSSKVKSSGYFGNPSTILTIASLVLSSIILITR